VLLAEHAPCAMRGGNSRHTRNLRAMHEDPAPPLTGRYGGDEYWDDLQRVTEGQTDEMLARLALRESASLMPWMQQRGVRFQPSLSGALALDRTNAFFLGGGKALLNALYRTAERLGVQIIYDTEVRSLDLRDGAVRSAGVVSRGFPAVIHARTVVAASGGFQANIVWLKEYWGEAAENFLIRGTPYAQGRILRHLLDQGAMPVGDPRQCHAVAIDARAPRFDGGIVTRLDCIPFGIMVDRTARRFYDEGEDLWPKRYAIWGRLVAQQPGQIAFCIVDSKAEKLFMPSVFPPVRAPNIAALAAALDLNGIALEATVAAYNESVREQKFDPDRLDGCCTAGLTPPKSHWARRIDTPPFLAWPLRPGITFTYLGLRVNEQARVLMQDGRPFANLFAAGEIMAGNVLGKGYLAGIGMTIGAAFGRIAGREAAKRARN
jgi:tricarballylate dehydrogenase